LEGRDEFGSAHRPELAIDKDLECLSAGEVGFSVEDGKAIMAHFQQVVVNQQCEAYVLTSLHRRAREENRALDPHDDVACLPFSGPRQGGDRRTVAARLRH
jgi:hypothetical protein